MNKTFPVSYFTGRATVRNYDQERTVSEELIADLLEQAAHAPNTGNMQLYSVVLTTDPEAIARLAPAHFSQPAIMGAKAVLTFCLDVRRYHRWCEAAAGVPGLNNLQGYTWAVMDTAIVAQQFVTLAELNGLGTCYLGTTTFNAPMIAQELKLPTGVVPLLTVTLGYPAGEPSVSERLPLSAILHRNTYHDPSDSELASIYSEKESMEEYKKFVEENGLKSLARVYSDIRYPREGNEHFSAVLKEFLKNQGIAL